jgi:hypothetical protein
MLARLRRRSDVFIDKLKTKQDARIGGVWQRPYIRSNAGVRIVAAAKSM